MTTLLNSHRRPCRIISFITQGVVRLQWRQVTSAGGGPGLALSWPDRRPLESSSPARGERSVTWITEEGLIVHKSTSERKPYNCLGPTKLLYSLPHRIVGILTTTVLMRLNTAWKLLAARLVKKKKTTDVKIPTMHDVSLLEWYVRQELMYFSSYCGWLFFQF